MNRAVSSGSIQFEGEYYKPSSLWCSSTESKFRKMTPVMIVKFRISSLNIILSSVYLKAFRLTCMSQTWILICSPFHSKCFSPLHLMLKHIDSVTLQANHRTNAHYFPFNYFILHIISYYYWLKHQQLKYMETWKQYSMNHWVHWNKCSNYP